MSVTTRYFLLQVLGLQTALIKYLIHFLGLSRKTIWLLKYPSVLVILCCSISVIAQQNGRISGKMTDSSTGESLLFANVILEGTVIGTTTDNNGNYSLVVPSGKHTIKFSYIGYKAIFEEVDVEAGQRLELNITLEPDVGVLAEVVVTGQLAGQQAAINQQINSNTIVSVVSKDKIEELPDQNAAETVGRLPGISVQRNAGEGQKVVVRGLSPRLSSITINGERIPSTDIEDRSVDLSMISADVLAGIEVFKALTPDKDGDAVGGTVNFVIKRAPEEFKGRLRAQYGYNGHSEEFGQYKGDFSISNRFFNNKLGVLLTGNYQKADRSSDALGASVRFLNEDAEGNAVLIYSDINLSDRLETRERYGGSLVLDYDLGSKRGITFNTIWGQTDREELRRRRRYRPDAGRHEYDIRDRRLDVFLISNILSGDHIVKSNWDLNWRVSHSFSAQNTPFRHEGRFRELAAFDPSDETNINSIIGAAKNNLDATFLKDTRFDKDDVDTRNLTGQVDLKIPVNITDNIGGFIKGGVKVRNENRSRRVSRIWSEAFGANEIGQVNPELYDLTPSGQILMSNFIGGFEAQNFLEGQYFLGPGSENVNGPNLDVDLVNAFYERHKNDPQYVSDPRVRLGDYDANERILAGYLMAEINIGEKLMILGGARHETTQLEYSSIFGRLVGDDDDQGDEEIDLIGVRDTTSSRSYSEILPMVHARYKFTDWFDVRAAVTKTLNRPNFFFLVPWARIDPNESIIERGNTALNHATIWNYDVFLSFYNRIGLLTIGGFHKRLNNIDYVRQSVFLEEGNTFGYDIIQPENGSSLTQIDGIEIDLQANLLWLPKPFDGIVFSANASFIRSETFFPFLEILQNPFRTIDSERVGRMPGQANRIYNLSLGYEKGGFSGRVSMIYQGNSLGQGGGASSRPGGYNISVGRRAEEDSFTASTTRYDLALKQKISNNFSVYFNMNNITNQAEREFVGTGQLTREEFFGMTSDLGLVFKF